MENCEMTAQQCAELIAKLGGMDIVNRILTNEMKAEVEVVSCIIQKRTVTVNIIKKIEKLFFHRDTDEIIHRYPCPENGIIESKEVAIFSFKKKITSEEVIARMEREGYQPGTIWDMLGWYESMGFMPKQYGDLVALGSKCQFYHPSLRHYRTSGDVLVEQPYSTSGEWSKWGAYCCFIGVQKNQQDLS